MKIVTFRAGGETSAGRLEDDTRVVPLPFRDAAELLSHGGEGISLAASAGAEPVDVAGLTLLPPVPSPGKVICVGLNYQAHVEEGRTPKEVPAFPVLFAKFADSLAGPRAAITLPAASAEADWEAELVIVIGARVKSVGQAAAAAAIGGFMVGNDLSMRDWQRRTGEWLQGKAWDAASPVGPAIVTPDEVGGPVPDLRITCTLNGDVMQDARTSEMIFNPAFLVSYVSTFTTLRVGDLIFTGTPSGVGAAQRPRVFLQPGDVLNTSIEGLGELRNECVAES